MIRHLILTTIFVFIICLLFGQSQGEMNQNKYNNYKEADSLLNSMYNQILKEYAGDTAFIKNLKKFQKIWIQFRDAELKVKYPDREEGYYGSMHPACISGYLFHLTFQRIKTLKEWIDGIPEGDGCQGSVKTKE